MNSADYIRLLERRIHNQRARLRQLEGFKRERLRSIWARIYLEWRNGKRALYYKGSDQKRLAKEAMNLRGEE